MTAWTRYIRGLLCLIVLVGATVLVAPQVAASSKKASPTTTTTTVPINNPIAHTPGATNPAVTQASINTTICNARYISKIRSQISNKIAAQTFAEYNIPKKKRSGYSIDHLVPLDLGGTNALSNLWPIPLKGNATPERKAVVDAAIHKSLCAGFISLAVAQAQFNASWPSVDTNLVTPAPTVSQPLWFFSDTGALAPFFREAVTVSNPGLEPVSGVKVSWTALNASGVLVGSYSSTLPVINALSSWTYIAGAGSGNLTGNPASANVVASGTGSYVKQVAAPYATDSVQFSISPYGGIYTGATQYSVTANVTIGSNQIPSNSLNVVIVLTDASGRLVGADFDQPTNLPSVLTSGLRIAIQDDLPATSMPTAAAVYAAPGA